MVMPATQHKLMCACNFTSPRMCRAFTQWVNTVKLSVSVRFISFDRLGIIINNTGHTYTHTHTHTHTRARTQCALIYTHAHTYMHTYIHKPTHVQNLNTIPTPKKNLTTANPQKSANIVKVSQSIYNFLFLYSFMLSSMLSTLFIFPLLSFADYWRGQDSSFGRALDSWSKDASLNAGRSSRRILFSRHFGSVQPSCYCRGT